MIYKLPDSSILQDAQFFTVQGPDNLYSGFQYNEETKTMYIKDAQVIYPSFHGMTHISEDPVPNATIDLPGLMSADDKAKLESLIQMKLGILGFQGAGFPDDGGWLEGPIIFASGSELLSIERMGNVVRFSVDSPVPLSCGCEECAQIYWIQDESEVSAIRPPSCAGKMPGANAYGELKVYLFPESTILDQNDPLATLNQKDQYPALVFKRYENNTNYSGQIEMILRRNSNLTANVGWAMTPGPQNTATAECVWFTGADEDGRTLRFDLHSETDPNMMGALLYNGHTLTRRMGIITGHDPSIGTTNQYKVKYWDIPNTQVTGEEFNATNIWQYDQYTTTPQLVMDRSVQLLPIGRLIKLWEFNIPNTSLVRRYFSDEPRLNPATVWTRSGSVTFGDEFVARTETDYPDAGGQVQIVDDLRTYEKSNWGIVGFPDPLYYKTGDGLVQGPINSLFSAEINYDLPGLEVVEREDFTEEIVDRYERPAYLWHRMNHGNFYMKAFVGHPEQSYYPPIDILFRSPIDSFSDTYVSVVATGETGGTGPGTDNQYYCIVRGADWSDLPHRGTIRFLTQTRNLVWRYDQKAFTNDADGSLMLLSYEPLPETTFDSVNPTAGEMSMAVVLHEDYDTYCCRLEFAVDTTPGGESVQLQFRVGILDMEVPYELNVTDEFDNIIQGFREGSYSVSQWFFQDGFWSGPNTTTSRPANFIAYPGGYVLGEEQWNKLELMCRDNQLWVWWNEMLVPPDAVENANISPSPVMEVDNPYFDLSGDSNQGVTPAPVDGKVGFRLWPGAKMRNVVIRDQSIGFNELSHGQLEVFD